MSSLLAPAATVGHTGSGHEVDQNGNVLDGARLPQYRLDLLGAVAGLRW